MRSSILGAALFVAGAVAVPFEKRVYVTDTDVHVVYVTDVVTVTGGASEATATPHKAAHQVSTDESNTYTHGGWGGWSSWGWTGSSTTEVQSAPEATSTPEPTLETVQQQAPQPTEEASSPSPAQPTHTSSRQVDPVQVKGSVPTSYAQVAVYAHNLHRRNHSAPDIKWSASLAASAQTIAESCVYAHNTNVDGGGYGQNIAAGVKPANISAVITDLFYNGEVGWYQGLYGLAQPPMTNFDHWGHMSQVVWKASTQVGCYTSFCANGLANTGGSVLPYFTVCNYKSAGNFANEYGINIGAPLGMPTASWSDGLNVGSLPTLP